MGIHITCKQAVDFMSKKEENKLNILQKAKLRYHLVICSLCKIFFVQNLLIIKAISTHLSQKDNHLSEEKKAEIIEVVLKEKK